MGTQYYIKQKNELSRTTHFHTTPSQKNHKPTLQKAKPKKATQGDK